MPDAEEYLSIQALSNQSLDRFPAADQKTRSWWEKLANPGAGPKRRGNQDAAMYRQHLDDIGQLPEALAEYLDRIIEGEEQNEQR